MRAVVQRVRDARVKVDGKIVADLERGILVYLGIGKNDTPADTSWLSEKAVSLRIFEDSAGKMNLSVRDVSGDVLVVSQFTLYADARKGRRPSYSDAAAPELAVKLYEDFIQAVRSTGIATHSGVFQAHMDISYTNDGPITILLDSKKLF